MKNYKDYINENQDKENLIVAKQLDGSTKYYSSHFLKYGYKKYEVKPSVIACFYDRNVLNSLVYKEFDLNSYINCRLRSLSQFLIKILSSEDIEYIFITDDSENPANNRYVLSRNSELPKGSVNYG